MDSKIRNAITPYGWTATGTNGIYQLSNRLGKMVCTVSLKKGRYKFLDTYGKLLLSGNKDLANAAVTVLTGYFFASLSDANVPAG